MMPVAIMTQPVVDTVIMTTEEVSKMYELGGYASSQTLMLLYRATRDGFGVAAFHTLCDGHYNTLMVVQSSLGFVFGGFTTQLWDDFGWRTDAAAYLFSLRRNVAGYNVTRDAMRFNNTNPANAIQALASHGPAFGGGYDLIINDASNMNLNSFVLFGNAYQVPPGYVNYKYNTSEYLGGCNSSSTDGTIYWCYFSTTEIEIFEVI